MQKREEREQEYAMICNSWAFDPQRSVDNTACVKQWTLKPCKTPGSHPKGHILQMRKTADRICSKLTLPKWYLATLQLLRLTFWFRWYWRGRPSGDTRCWTTGGWWYSKALCQPRWILFCLIHNEVQLQVKSFLSVLFQSALNLVLDNLSRAIKRMLPYINMI